MRKRVFLLSAILLGACAGEAPPPRAPSASTLSPVAATTAAPAPAPPPTVPLQVCASPRAREADTSEVKFGITVADPYRWMEGNDNAELTTWLRAQGDCTQHYIGRIAARDTLFRRLRELGLGTSSQYSMHLAGRRAFFQEVRAGEQLSSLVVREANGQQRILVDPSKLGQGTSHASVNAFSPSPDGKLVAYDLALGGGEVSSIHVMDVTKGTDLPDVIDHVWGEFAAAWLPDGKSFFYTQMTQMAAAKPDVDPLQNMQARYHVLGQPVAKDVALLGNGATATLPVAPEEFPGVSVLPGVSWAFAVMRGAHSEVRVAIAPLAKLDRSGAGKTPWRVVAEYADQVEDFEPHGDRLYVTTFKEAPNRKVLSVPLADPDLSKAKVEIPESPEATIRDITEARDGLYMKTMTSGRARLWRVAGNKPPVPIALPFEGWVNELTTDRLGDGARFDMVGWTRPTAFYDVNVKGAVTPSGIATKTNADFSNIVADQVEATSSDGTAVPLSILHPKDLTMDGSRPALLYGYGGYGSSQNPSFSSTRLPWLELGSTYAVCHVRGGGEKGRRWQDGGSHEHKMNGIHDFEACAQYLIDHKFTSASHLAAWGRSAGGILIGRAVTDRPDLFVAANIAVGLVNTTRLLAAENGANQKFELGDPETEGGFKALYDMDSFQHVAPNTAYPATIFTIGLNDKRVPPWMTAKMGARMQALSTSGRPILVRIDADAGHGVGSTRDQTFAELADVYSFILASAGEKAFQGL
jgi:prolyl oligopeptidase